MSKSELIHAITKLNRSARPEFLAEFSTQVLADYLTRLAPLEQLPQTTAEERAEPAAQAETTVTAS